jgi:hypothetical protein
VVVTPERLAEIGAAVRSDLEALIMRADSIITEYRALACRAAAVPKPRRTAELTAACGWCDEVATSIAASITTNAAAAFDAMPGKLDHLERAMAALRTEIAHVASKGS